jgi:hypothetical protein
MLIEYYATEAEDRQLEQMIKSDAILEWFNPECGYYILETDDPQVLTIMHLMGLEVYVSARAEKITTTSAKL